MEHHQIFAYNFLIILIIFSINANTQEHNFTSVPTFTYDENNFTGKPLVKNIDSFPDGTVIVRIMNELNDSQKIYYDQILFLRIIHPNGSVTEINNKYDIPDYNFNAGDKLNPLDVYPLFDKYILVVYSTALDWNNNDTYRDRGMIIDWSGNNISDIEFGKSYVDDDHDVGLIPNQATFAVNSDRTKGFLRFSQYTNSSDAVWNQYFVNSMGHLNMTGSGNISNFYPTYDQKYAIFSTTNNDYAIVYLNTINATDTTAPNINTPFEIHGEINAIFIRYDQNNQNISYGPITLYETKEDIILKYIYCFINITNVGNTCKIIVSANNTNYFCNIQFLSSGSVLDFSSFPVNNISENDFEVISLPFGSPFGDYVIVDRLNDSNTTFNLTLFNEKGENLSSIQIKSNFHGAHTMDALPNNTIFFTKPDTENSSWGIFGYRIPYEDIIGFHNLLINSSFPNSNTILNIRNTSNLTINYTIPIMQSSCNLLIYQINQTDTKILRQNYSGLSPYCSVNDSTISCKILSSTFNVLSSTYHIIVENGFVKDSKYQEQLQGIPDKLWVVYTKSVPQNDEYDEYVGKSYSVTGYLRLSETGIRRFKNLSSSEQQKNIQSLSEELVKNIPIDPSRLKFSGRLEFDSNGWVLLELSINAQVPNISSQPNVNHIMEDLNALIGNKSITNLTNLFLDIDEKHQFKPRSRSQKKCLYLHEFSHVKSCPHKLECLSEFKCHNIQKDEFKNVFSQNNCSGIIFFTTILSIIRLVANILFVIYNVQNVATINLFIPSIVILSTEFSLNIIFAFIILSKESSNRYFRKWFANNTIYAAFFTLLASADIEILLFLNSHFAGLNMFTVPFSNQAKNFIFWSKILNTIVNDIPWLIIQVLYYLHTITYKAVPLLTLIISFISLGILILKKAYGFISKYHYKAYKILSDKNFDVGNDTENLDVKEKFTNGSFLYKNKDTTDVIYDNQ
ncbi:hypothetical protein F8M41_020250 [Gigaspora margarita]|uniref:Uncharacterized protein n=1 Tax=Gigaspora margarita TaxID=4874 RepID=A0A8H4ETW2_GIGMA|nr:hypothetical protein F8M41_020250 [Gigaspora margarita]